LRCKWNKIEQHNVSFDGNSAALLTENDAVLIDLAMAAMFRHAAGITTILLYCLYYGPDADLSSEIIGEFKRNKLGVPYCVQKCVTPTTIQVLVTETMTHRYSNNQDVHGVINLTGDWTAVCYLTYESNGLNKRRRGNIYEKTRI